MRCALFDGTGSSYRMSEIAKKRRVAKRPSGAPKSDVAEKPSTKKVASKRTRKSVEAVESKKESVAPTAKRSALAPIFQAPEISPVSARTSKPAKSTAADVKKSSKKVDSNKVNAKKVEPIKEDKNPKKASTTKTGANKTEIVDRDFNDSESDSASKRRRRRRGGRGRKRVGPETVNSAKEETSEKESNSSEGSSHRKRVRARRSSEEESAPQENSTRIDAKRHRRRDSREHVRRRAPILTESQFLARRESVERKMLVRQSGDRTQICVIEDNILVEHYVNRSSNTSYVGNVYLGRVQNVLPSMEAAFVDIGKGRNAVLYAGEVNWDAAGLADGTPRRIELALKTGQQVLVQVTKDPIGQKGARLTSQVSLPGRYLVYVPGGGMSGISRRLPDAERSRLKSILKDLVPEESGVIVRTAAEGATEEELSRDVTRLKAQWEDIQKKSEQLSSATAPTLLYGEPDLAVRVIRDIFNEDFLTMHVQGVDAWDEINAYLGHVAPDLVNKIHRWTSEKDLFSEYRVDEQLAKALDRKVWLPSGGSLVIDRTEAMVVVDVNTGKFTGKGGNLEETVTKNNLEAAEEIARQLRLRDLGGIIVVDFIDMVLESNRDLVLRRLVECLGRDRTKHQVAEVTSLGLVQMTRKRVGQGLIEAFSTTCDHCQGRGIHVSLEPVDKPDFHRTKTHHHYEDVHDDNTSVDPVTDSAAESNGESKFAEKVESKKSVAIKGDRKRPRRGKG